MNNLTVKQTRSTQVNHNAKIKTNNICCKTEKEFILLAWGLPWEENRLFSVDVTHVRFHEFHNGTH